MNIEASRADFSNAEIQKTEIPVAERVVLLHGLGRTSGSMVRLGRALKRAGFEPLDWGYPSRRSRLDQHIDWLVGRFSELAADPGPVHFVGHSLGALIARGALSGREKSLPFELGRMVMLGPPNSGSGLLDRFGGRLPTRLIFGKPVIDLHGGAETLARLGVPATEIGVIAGTRRLHPLNPVSWLSHHFGSDEPHDGTVEVSRTRLPGMADFITVDAHHTFICDHPLVISQTIAFLKTGAFKHDPE